MLTTRAPIPPDFERGFAAAFPGDRASLSNPDDSPEPVALLSFAPLGDMKLGDRRGAANRELFLRDAGLDPERVICLEPAHSRKVLFPARDEAPGILAKDLAGADGLVLRDPDLGAALTVADCMPIWILDRESGAFGVLHSGWRGTGILEVAIRAMVERFGSRTSSIAVILGPAIGPCCYSVSEERAAAFSAEFGENCVERRGGSSYIDLRSANVSIAEKSGIGHLLSIDACTSCDGRLGSFRRQGGASFTRMLAVCHGASRVAGLAPLGPL